MIPPRKRRTPPQRVTTAKNARNTHQKTHTNGRPPFAFPVAVPWPHAGKNHATRSCRGPFPKGRLIRDLRCSPLGFLGGGRPSPTQTARGTPYGRRGPFSKHFFFSIGSRFGSLFGFAAVEMVRFTEPTRPLGIALGKLFCWVPFCGSPDPEETPNGRHHRLALRNVPRTPPKTQGSRQVCPGGMER
ncbi:uncharacterized protein TM35_000931000 [Trypanosoma theileri]|uniref:Uncharacterized protein n=1 Tax=Trypanosoma theileri TaxID=67003 RepID=A0A1X0NGB3_9TRYP|nr:uncharacterized protein TM35_000931000 [Trypanosoma theileri]ORC82342.1 hypothetical protein TM35_000931000 [Trypanosoma theileri]